MSKFSSLLTLAIAAIVAGFWPSGANAGVYLPNGLTTNGVHLANGVNITNGINLTNGININNGMKIQNGLSTNGLSLHGVRLVLPDGTELAFR